MAKEKLTNEQKKEKLLAKLEKINDAIKEEKKKEKENWHKNIVKEFKIFPKTDYSKLADYLIRNKQAIAEKLDFVEKSENTQK